MIRLPRGNTVRENIDLTKVDLPEALKTLRQGRFTGYLLFDLSGASSVFVLCQGKMIETLYEDSKCSLAARLGLERTFQEVQKHGGRLNIYRLSTDLAGQLPVVLGGNALLLGEALQGINIKAILTRMSREKRSGCLRIYSDQRVALIFYKDGRPLGFFHDGCGELATDADLSMSVARDEGARLDVLVPAEGILFDQVDLMDDAEAMLS
ncbi:MAG: hypothetical protein KAT93_05975 [Desulfuromonadales bacterium]|nr:hypothetical protein [Desulfuromonadales bacterium]